MIAHPRSQQGASRWIRHTAEGLAFGSSVRLLRLLSIERASAAGGAFGRLVGPHLKRNQVVLSNLRHALPELGDEEHIRIATQMWENLGRNFGEFAHLDRIYAAGRVKIEGLEHILSLRDDGIGGIFFSAHLGNWELLSISLAINGIRPVCIYRPATAPLIERVIQERRGTAHRASGARYVAKTPQGMREAVHAIRNGLHLAMLVDQKLNRGIPVPFFGRAAMTAPAIAQIALKYRVPLVPARIVRKRDATFELRVLPPLQLPDTGCSERDVMTVMCGINGLIEEWIRERPEQWLWAHRRWPREDQPAAPDVVADA